jgi:hypothetical protein
MASGSDKIDFMLDSDSDGSDSDDDVPLAELLNCDAESSDDEVILSDLANRDDMSRCMDVDQDDDDTPLVDSLPLSTTQWCKPPRILSRPKLIPDLPTTPNVAGDPESLQGKTALEFFHMMFPVKLFDIIASQTNKYAEDVKDTRDFRPKSRFRRWSETNGSEIKAFIGLRIAMGMCHKPNLDDYWGDWWCTQTPGFSRVMSKNRFRLLSSFLHFVDNEDRLTEDDPNYDPMFKVRPVLNEVLPAWERCFVPGKHLSIDESMVGFRGKIFFRQYIKSKRHRFGMKAFVLSCGVTSYTIRWDMYTGSAYEYDRDVGQGHSVVRKLTDGLSPGHVLYLDSFYTTPELCKELFEKNIGVCGTVGQNRRGMPDALKDRQLKLKEGASPVYCYKSPVLACAFHDRKIVRLLSTVHGMETFTKEVIVPKSKRSKYPSGRRNVCKPVMVNDYNRYMGGVDRSDQMSSYHPFPHRTVKWYIRLFSHIVEICMINARILYNLVNHTHKLSAENFRKKLVDGMLSSHISATSKLPSTEAPVMGGVPPRLLGRHFQGKFAKKKPDCIVCSNRKIKRHQTSHFCKTCPDHPALCDIPCFEIYHTQMQYK